MMSSLTVEQCGSESNPLSWYSNAFFFSIFLQSPLKMFTKTPAELKAGKRGRKYQCVRCMNKGEEYFNTKSRMEGHIIKPHLGLDQIPFYCNLCMFKCRDYPTLKDHVTKFPRHRAVVNEKKLEPDDLSSLRLPNHTSLGILTSSSTLELILSTTSCLERREPYHLIQCS